MKRTISAAAICCSAAACMGAVVATAGAAGPGGGARVDHGGGLSVKSSLEGHTALPHRIKWTATPSVPSAQISHVEFLIDGRLDWEEFSAPYYYGGDGNFLVTSFLRPGQHTFTVKAMTFHGKTASTTVTARVPVAPAPPRALAGTWKRFLKNTSSAPTGSSNPPTGNWRLVINRVGWEISDTAGGRNVIDVAYLAPGRVEIRTGMATGHDQVVGAAHDDDLNGWCNNDPGKPVRYRWSVSGTQLQLRYVSGHACPGFTQFLTGTAMTR